MAAGHTLRKTLLTLLKVAVTLLIIWFLVKKLGVNAIVATVMQARFDWLLAALAVFVASVFIGVLQWQLLLKSRGIPLPFGRATRLYFMGMFFNNFVFGGIVGDAVKVGSIHLHDKQGRAGLAATFLDRFVGMWAMFGFAIAGSAVLLRRGMATNHKIDTAMIALLVTFIVFAGIITLLVSRRTQRLFFSLFDRLRIPQKQRIRDIISEMLFEAEDRHMLFLVVLLSSFIQFIRIGVHIMVGASLGLVSAANFQYFFIFVPLLATVMIIPLPLFVREALGGALFAMAGFPQHRAFVMSFLASLVGLAGSLPGAAMFVIGRKSENKQMPNVHQGAQNAQRKADPSDIPTDCP